MQVITNNNAKVRREKINKLVIRKDSLHQYSNMNGEKVIEL